MFKNQKELEKKFPAVPNEIFEERIKRLTFELEQQGFVKTYDNNDGYIVFEKMYFCRHTVRRFGLWQLHHEPDVDFEITIQRIRTWKW